MVRAANAKAGRCGPLVVQRSPFHRQQQEREELEARLAAPPEPGHKHRCAAHGCSSLTQRGTGDGLSPTYCRRHVEFVARHGSSWRKSLSQSELEPYRKAASRWLDGMAHDPMIGQAMAELEAKMVSAGPVILSPFLHEEGAESRAKQVWARTRDRHIAPISILSTIIAVKLALRELDGIPRSDEYHETQLAKRLHRMAGGFHIRDGGKKVWQWHPEPRGQLLRHLGKELEVVLKRALGREDWTALAAMVKAPARKA